MDDSRIFRRDGAAEPGQVLQFRQAAAQHGPADAGDAHAQRDASHVGLSSGELSTADLFDVLWRGLADILGTAATATLLRRAAQRALPRWPELSTLSITRERLEYAYILPSNWRKRVSDPPYALAALIRELWPLLVDLTGPVVVRRLAQLPELQASGILPSEEAST